MRYVILDSETTGISTKQGHRIIELAMLEMIDRELTSKKYHCYFNPDKHIEESATAVHGITDTQMSTMPHFVDEIANIIAFIKDSTIIAHNAKFDIEFLDMELQKSNHHSSSSYVSGVIDTLDIARTKYPKQKNSLDALCDRLDIDRTNRGFHGALIDCELLYQVYLKLVDIPQIPEQIVFDKFDNIDLPIIYADEKDNKLHNKYMESINVS